MRLQQGRGIRDAGAGAQYGGAEALGKRMKVAKVTRAEMAKALETGLPKMRIEEAAARTQARIDSGRQSIVGLNRFPVEHEEEIDEDFDFMTDDAIVCSELVYKAYQPLLEKTGRGFALARTSGRFTCRPVTTSSPKMRTPRTRRAKTCAVTTSAPAKGATQK